uniref:Obtusifoliol 14-alpha demethylase n=1 Tax=Oryza punctata TaxID=4537 RepID=A0A0E0L2K5_ORYPU
MELTSSSVTWLAMVILVITAAVTKIATGRKRSATDLTCKMPPPPPVVNSIALLRLLPTLFRSGLPAILHQLYMKFGSVFTISVAGLLKMTFLVGPEVSAHFFQGLESEVSHGNLFEFTVPMFGKEIAHGVDSATKNEQARFFVDALKPARLRIHVDPMVQEVEDYFAKWGQHGTVDLRRELEQLLLLISGRCLLGKEVMGTMFDEVCSLFRDIEGGVNMMSVFFPYTPLIPSNRRRDMARERLHAIFSDIVRSRKQQQGDGVDKDVLQSLIDSRYKVDGRATTEAEVAALMICLLFAAKHTSAYTSVWTGARLLSHGKFLAAAVDEQDEIVRQHGINGGRITDHYGSLMEMRTLHSCIKETLRLHPPVPVLTRTAHKQFTVRTREGHEYAVPAGHTIACPIVISNQVPYIYKDGHLYDPGRFGPGREEDKVGGKFSYASFGGGRTSCVGEGYAYMQIKVIWSHLLRNFELRLLSPLPKSDWSKTMAATKLARVKRPIALNPRSNRPLPPVVNSIALLEHLPRLFTKGVIALMHDLYTRFGNVFTATFLVGPEVSAHFYQGMDSEISQGDLYKFTVPMFAKGLDYFAKWGETVGLAWAESCSHTSQLRHTFDATKHTPNSQKIFSEIVRSRRDTNQLPAEQDRWKLRDRTRGHGTPEGPWGNGEWLRDTNVTGARLLTHDKFVTEALEEQKHMIQKHGDHICYNVLLDMDILHCCIKEA